MPNELEVSIKFMVPAAIRQSISSAFGPFEEGEEERVIESIAQLSFKSFTDWLTGNKRYRSLTEQYIDWVEQIYLNLLPENEAPSVQRIYNSMNMPFGQASYIARVLAEKTLVRWRELAVNELRDALRDIEEHSRKYINDGDQAQEINIQISLIAYQELLRICSTRRRSDRSYLMPKPGVYSGDYRFVSVPSCTVVDLIDHPNW